MTQVNALANTSIVGVPAVDTVKQVIRGTTHVRVRATLPREKLVMAQTPQVFRYDWIVAAHDKAVRERIVVEDDAELIEKLGKPVKVFTGSYSNLKVATREDALMVEALLAAHPVSV